MQTDCSNCGEPLTPETATVESDQNNDMTATDALALVTQTGDQMLNVVVRCDSCGNSWSRSVTIRTPE